jgi:diacylglycerol kinase family enzyme
MKPAPDESTLPLHLRPDREIHVVISILSGLCQANEYYEESIKPLLDQHDIKYITHWTTSVKTIIELSENIFIPNARQGVKQTIILLSGDGGVLDIVNTFTAVLDRKNDELRAGSIFLKPAIVLIPKGTANALAWSSGGGDDCLKTMMEGTPKSLPIFKASFSAGTKIVLNEGRDRENLSASDQDEGVAYGAVVCSWGLHANVLAISDTTEYRKHGRARFMMAAEELTKDPPIYRGIVKRRKRNGDWESFPETEHAYVMATLAPKLEEKFLISPDTKGLDGTLHLVTIPPGAEFIRIMMLVYNGGQHVTDPSVTYEAIEGLRIEFHNEEAQWRQICIDGKIFEPGQGGWMELTRLPDSGMDARRVVELVS